MSLFLLLTGSIFILHTTELLLTIAGALLSGYLLKLLLDKFWFNSKKDETDELETELVTLQGRFSAEMIKKEAVSKLLQEDVKAAEKKNFDLQIQYAKALNHIEKIKINWHGDDDEIQFDTDDAGNRILLNLQEKITRQEAGMLQLELQLQQSEQKKYELELLYKQESAVIAEYKNAGEQQQKEKEIIVLKLQSQLHEQEELLKENREKIIQAAEREEQLQIQIGRNAEHHSEEALQQEILHLKNELKNTETTSASIAETATHKEGIDAIRSGAEQVNETIENFRQNLTDILRDTYSYDQLLTSNERLHVTIGQLQDEKQTAEEQLIELQQVKASKTELEEKLLKISGELKVLQQTRQVFDAEQNAMIEKLQQQINEKVIALNELMQIKSKLQLTVDELQQKLGEKERLSREMIHAVKDIENRFADMYSHEEETTATQNGGMLYR